MSKRKKEEKQGVPSAKAKRTDANGKPICGAKLKRGKPGVCQQPPMPNGRCYHHGGASPVAGPTHPSYTHGKRSKYLPQAVAKHFDEAMDDPEFLSVRENAALVYARKKQLEQRLETGESSSTWAELREVWGDFRRGQRLQKEATATDSDELRQSLLAESRTLITESLEAADRLISGGASEQTQWNELLKINAHEGQLKAAEVVRLQRAAEIMTMGEVAIFIHQLQQAVCSIISDKDQLRKIGTAFDYIMRTGSLPAGGVGAGEVVGVPAITIEQVTPPPQAPPEQKEEKRE